MNTPSNRLKAFLNFMDGEDGDLKDFPPGYMEEGFRADLRDTLGRLAAVEEGLEGLRALSEKSNGYDNGAFVRAAVNLVRELLK